MNLKKSWKRFTQYFTDNFIMPTELKRRLVDANFKPLLALIILLNIFSVFMLVLSLIRRYGNYESYLYELIYYFGIAFFSIQNLIYLYLVFKHKDWPPIQKNQGLYMSYVLLLGICTYMFYFGHSPLNAFIIFAIVAFFTNLFFNIEPIFYNLMTLTFSIIIIIKCFRLGLNIEAFDIIFFNILTTYASFYKWGTIIDNFQYSKKLEVHTKDMENEIQLATYVQQSFYKTDFSNFENYEIRVYNQAMAGVSGDLYDFYKTDSKLDGLGIFDISGHGIAAGLVTMLVRNIIHQEFYQNIDKPLTEVAKIIDSRVKEEKRDIQNYLTGVLVRFNGAKLELINAGHVNPIIYRKEVNGIHYVDKEKLFPSTVIGLNSIDSFFNEIDLEMNSGDELFLYTDGFLDSQNSNKENYGKERLSESIIKAIEYDLDDQIPSILKCFNDFREEEPLNDDITVMIIKRK